MNYKRITLLSGHYGSGKTNVAVNMALDLKRQHDRVALADLDIVNPYFRSLDSRDQMEEAGVRMIVSGFANSNVDLPSLPQEIYTLVDDPELYSIVDVGGDERGALALGRISDRIRESGDYDMYLVINRFRPLTRDAASVLEIKQEIEAACRLPFTGIINDSNLGADTDPDTVLSSLAFGQETAALCGLPLIATCCEAGLATSLRESIPDLFPLTLQKRPVD